MIVGVPRETYPGERRVALVPAVLPALAKRECEVLVEAGAGAAAGYPDAAYVERGARVVATRGEVFGQADVVLQVLCHGANDRTGAADLPLLRAGQTLVGFLRPLDSAHTVQEIAATGVNAFSVELMPRITRAQSMDVLSAMSTVAGYKAVLLSASLLPRMFPMLMTAAGTITPARVLVVGAGVAGLQAIATARRLGAVVWAYDVRPAAKEQVESLGGRFVELPLETGDAEDARGYAKAKDEDFYRRQRELMGRVVAESDVVITTAVVPGRRAPVLVTADMVAAMTPGSVVVDLAAERGGNCEPTRPGETITVPPGVTVVGAVNLAGTVPYHASQLYARTVSTFLLHLLGDAGVRTDDANDEIVRETLVARGGEVVHPRVREALGAARPDGKEG
jgi:H+-translocating NAD(P) transhydrogenase subunit alpha